MMEYPTMEVLLSIVVIFLIVPAAINIFRFTQEQWRFRKMMRCFKGPPGKWLFGNIGDIKGTGHNAMFEKTKIYTQLYGEAFRMNFMNQNYLFFTSPENLAAVYNTNAPKHAVGYKSLRQWIGDGILLSQGDKWFRNRRLLTPAFHFDILKPYTQVFSDTANIMITKWHNLCQPAESLEMFEHIKLMTLDGLLMTAFSSHTDCQNLGTQHDYINAVYAASELLPRRLQSLLYRNNFIYYNLTNDGLRMKKVIKDCRDFTRTIMRNRKQTMDKLQRKYLDFLDILLNAKDEDGVGLTEEEILDEVDTFMFAGHDTTASGLSWFFYNMAHHHDHQLRCQQEVQDVLGDRNSIKWSDLSKLEYLTMCLKESLRVHPPVPYVSRTLHEDLTLPDGRVAPKGVHIRLGIYYCHHNPAVWENPEEYDPQRFSPENSQDRHSHAFIPFAAGSRNCIGQHFAMNELKVVAALVLKNFHMDPDPDRKPIMESKITLRAKEGLWLKVTPIHAYK